jgi:acetyl-CoA carboxylase carboxyltransferase component
MKLTKAMTEAPKKPSTAEAWGALCKNFADEENRLRQGGGVSGQERQQRLGRLPVRERLKLLLDSTEPSVELNLWAGEGMYSQWGSLPAAGVVTVIGNVSGRACMVIANDATVKAGAMFPQSVKKVLRAQRIAFECRLPTIYLVDSSGVFLPLQEDVFPDEDDFGRIFRNNAIFSASGIPQFAAIMGNCIAGGGYLPVLCDKLLMTQGSGLYLAGPALVKAAIGQVVDTEQLGGAKMHAEMSGTVDFLEANDYTCLQRLRSLVALLPESFAPLSSDDRVATASSSSKLCEIVAPDNQTPYDVHNLLQCLVDADSLQEYKASYGKTLLTAYARINGQPIGIVANQRAHALTGRGEIEIGGVLYAESADKAARFIMDCNQIKVPLLFIQDVSGFMVGKDAEQSGIIRSGAKMVSAVSNSVVPKITLVVGNSFGAGNYVMCGRAYDPNFIIAWPNAKFAVMGGEQAASTLAAIYSKGKNENSSADKEMLQLIKDNYTTQMDIRYGAARGWVDAIIDPASTRQVLIKLLACTSRAPLAARTFHTGVFQV